MNQVNLSIVVCLLQVLSFFSLAAQTSSPPVIEWGPVMEGEMGMMPEQFVASFDGNHVFMFKKLGYQKEKHLMVFNDDLELVGKHKLMLGENKKDRRKFLDIRQWGDELYVFSSFTNKSDKKQHIIVETLDRTTFKSNGDLRTIYSIDFNGFSRLNSGKIELHWSEDSSHLMLRYDMPFKRGEQERLGFQVFEHGMKLLSESEVTLPFADLLYEVQNQAVDEAGDTYVFGHLYQKIDRRFQEYPVYEPHLWVIRNGTDDAMELPLDFGKYLPQEMKMTTASNGDLLCTGFYSLQNEQGIKGVYYLRIDKQTGKTQSSSILPFSKELLAMNQRGRTRRKSEGDSNNESYKLDYLVNQPDDGLLLIGEQYYKSVSIQGNSTTGSMSSHYDDVILVSINQEGEVNWTHKVPKRSGSPNYGQLCMSYAVIKRDKYYYIVYNDHVGNADYKGVGELKPLTLKEGETRFVAAVIDQNGPLGIDTWVDDVAFGTNPIPKQIAILPDGRLFVLGIAYPEYRAGMVSFP